MQPGEYSDADLVAYLDGGLDADTRASIEDAVATDPELAVRLGALSLDVDALRDGFDDLLGGAPDLEVPEPAPRRGWGFGWAAAAVALFAIGLGAGWGLAPRGEAENWHQAVADYQVLYTTETLAATPLAAEARASGLANASERIGLELTEENLAVDGMTLQRAQVLSYEGAPLIQVAYLTDDGAPVAFCIMKAREAGSPDPRGFEIAGLEAATWEAGAHAFILIGPVDDEALGAKARSLASRFQG